MTGARIPLENRTGLPTNATTGRVDYQDQNTFFQIHGSNLAERSMRAGGSLIKTDTWFRIGQDRRQKRCTSLEIAITMPGGSTRMDSFLWSTQGTLSNTGHRLVFRVSALFAIPYHLINRYLSS